MAGVATAIQEMLLAAVIKQNVLAPRKSRAEWGLTALSALLACTGALLSVLGLERFLETQYLPYMAALLTAAVVFGLAALSAMAGTYLRRRKRDHLVEAQNALGQNIAALIEDACNEIEGPVRENPKMAVLLATLAGFFVARQRF